MLTTMMFDFLYKLNYNTSMKDQDEFLENIVIDVCKRTFMMYSDDGSKRKVQCDTTKQFMEVLALVLTNADPDIVEYADVSVQE